MTRRRAANMSRCRRIIVWLGRLNKQYIIFPGVVWRTWTATTLYGNVRKYDKSEVICWNNCTKSNWRVPVLEKQCSVFQPTPKWYAFANCVLWYMEAPVRHNWIINSHTFYLHDRCALWRSTGGPVVHTYIYTFYYSDMFVDERVERKRSHQLHKIRSSYYAQIVCWFST